MKPRILFITHETSLSGAPILLLNLMKMLSAEGVCELNIIVFRGGPLEKEFHSLGDAVTLKREGYFTGGPLSKLKDYATYRRQLGKAKKLAAECDLIFSNTVTNGRLLKELSAARKPVVIYVHELENVIREFNKHNDAVLSLQLADCILTPSSAVRDNLVNNHAVKNEKLLPLNYYFPAGQQVSTSNKEQKRKKFIHKQGIDEGKFLVTGMGSATERKGFDIFLEACLISVKRGENIHWVWVGDFVEAAFRSEMQKIIQENNLDQHLTITGFLPKGADNLLPFELFLLPSREDPYPLVVLEAAYLGIPSVCFLDGGGIIDFVKDGAGFILREQNAAAFADEVIRLKNDPEAIALAGKTAKEKALNLHSSESLIIEQFNAAFKKANS